MWSLKFSGDHGSDRSQALRGFIMGLLRDKVAVVTGAGRGIGRAVALALAAEGAAVALAARTEEEIRSAAHEIRTLGGQAIAVPVDVTRQDEVDCLFRQVSDRLGPIDVLVNNAGLVGPVGVLWETDLASWWELFDVNVFGVVRCCRAALPLMIAHRDGTIINVGSDAGWSEEWAADNPELAAYGAAKAAVMRFTLVLAKQVRAYGININCLGVNAETRLAHEASSAVARARRVTGLGPSFVDGVSPDENVGAFIFLASSLSDHVTGAYFEANKLPNRYRCGSDR